LHRISDPRERPGHRHLAAAKGWYGKSRNTVAFGEAGDGLMPWVVGQNTRRGFQPAPGREKTMNTPVSPKTMKTVPLNLPEHRDVFYGGEWRKPKSGHHVDAINPGLNAVRNVFVDHAETASLDCKWN
jgi:hypothetical protein